MSGVSRTFNYHEQVALEALSVGVMTAGLSNLLEKIFPRLSPSIRLVLVGALFHIGAEASGMNRWYLFNGANALEYDSKNPEEKLRPTIRKSTCQFTSWDPSAPSCFLED
jgi:hypothetical protein